MSMKTDLLLLGALGVGAYFLIVNADKIGAWLGSQLGVAAAGAAGAAGQAVVQGAENILAVPGTALAVWQYEFSLLQQQQFRTLQVDLLNQVDVAMKKGDTESAQAAYEKSVEARIAALESSPGGLSDVGRQAILDQEKETLKRVFGVDSSPPAAPAPSSFSLAPPAVITPEQARAAALAAFQQPTLTQLASKTQEARTTAPGDQTGAQTFSSTPPAATTITSTQRAEAVALVSQPGYNVNQFAMPGSPAWIVAHGG